MTCDTIFFSVARARAVELSNSLFASLFLRIFWWWWVKRCLLRLWESCRCVFVDFKNHRHLYSEPNRVFRESSDTKRNARWWWCVKKYNSLHYWDTRWLQNWSVRWTSARDVARADPIAEMMKQSVCARCSLSLSYFFFVSRFSLSLSFRFAEQRAFVFASGMLAMIGRKS